MKKFAGNATIHAVMNVNIAMTATVKELQALPVRPAQPDLREAAILQTL
jgi:hypothetical protein